MPTVLVVEDETNIRQFVAVNLRARGYQVLQAETAEDGLQQLREVAPAALILDIKLPGMNGWKMLDVIDHDPALRRVPVIVMTASSSISQPDEYPYPNLVEKLIKPISVNDLLRVLKKASL